MSGNGNAPDARALEVASTKVAQHSRYSVDVCVVAMESLYGLTCPNIPQLSRCVARTRHKNVGIRAEGNTVHARWSGGQSVLGRRPSRVWGWRSPHDVSSMVVELHATRAGFDVPEKTSHVPGGGDDLSIVEEATAGEISGVSCKLSRDLDRSVSGAEVVYGAGIVETPAGDEVARRRVGAGHDPRGA